MSLYENPCRAFCEAIKRKYVLVAFLAGGLLAGSFHPVVAQLRYDEIQQRSIHNAYDKHEQILDELIKYRVRELEFDIHPVGDMYCGPNASCPSVPNWYVYHTMGQIGRNVCSLREALGLLKAFHDAVPAHEVITVHLELKGWGLSRATFNCFSPAALDQLIFDVLGRANVFTPRDLLATKPGATTLYQAVGNPVIIGAPPGDGWPTVDSLRGKFLFVMHSEEGSPREIEVYMQPTPLARAGFVMRNWGAATLEELASMPNTLFFGEIEPPEYGRHIKDYLPYLILRGKQQDGEPGFRLFQEGRGGRGINLLLTDKVSHYIDPWARTHNANLYPFGRAGEVGAAAFTHPSVATRQEIGALFELATYSGDLDGTRDSFSFAPAVTPPSNPDVWQAAIATTSNSSVHAWGKGMLMARESMSPDAPYFAVGRAADKYGIFLQYRAPGCSGPCGTAHEDLGDLGGVEDENVHFVRLEIKDGAPGSTIFQAYASVDGVNFLPFSRAISMPGTFSWRGFAASSHGSTDAGADMESFYFQAVKRNGFAINGSIFKGAVGIPGPGTRSRLTVFGVQPKLILTPATDTKRVGTPETLTAKLVDCSDPNVTVTFTVTGANARTGTGAVACGGATTFTYTGTSAGIDIVRATAATSLPPASLAPDPATILWEKSPTTLTYTGPTRIANGQPVTLSGILRDDASAPVAGRIVGFTLGTGAGAQSCSGTTDAAGAASCNLSAVGQPLGPGSVQAVFAGDNAYLPSSGNKATLIFAFAASGSFVIGDRSASVAVTFWGAEWARVNALSGGGAPNSFKGFANTLSSSPPQCGGSWSTRSGSSPPAAPLPEYMAVLVASLVTRSGSMISGNISSIVIVKTDPGYEPDPAHPGTGTVVAVLCP